MSTAELKFKQADRLYHTAIKVFFVFTFIMLIVIVYQVAHLQGDFSNAQTAELKRQEQARVESRARLDKALEETNRQQVVTQNYIRCVASVLLKPVEQRSMQDFDNCGIPGVTDPANLGQPNTNQGATAPNQQSPAIVTPNTQSSQPTTSQPVAGGSPPDDNDAAPTPEDDRSALGRLPLVGGLFDAIGL